MSFAHATGSMLGFLAQLAGMAQRYSWYVIYNNNRWIFLVTSVAIGFLAPNMRRHYPPKKQHPDEVYALKDRIPVRLTWRPLRSLTGALAGLSISSGLITGSILLHAADPYWLPAGTEKASHIAAPQISAPAVSAPGGNLPFGIGTALKTLAGAITGSLQHAVQGTNTALGGITNAGNAVIDMGLRIRAATIAGQVAFQFGVLWLLSTILLVIIIAITLSLFVMRTSRKLWEITKQSLPRIFATLREFGQQLYELGREVFLHRRQIRELQQTVAYMADLLSRHPEIWPADQPLPSFEGDRQQDDTGQYDWPRENAQQMLPYADNPDKWPLPGYRSHHEYPDQGQHDQGDYGRQWLPN